VRKISILAGIAVAAMIGGFQSAQAGLLGMPTGLHAAIENIKFEMPPRVPVTFPQFCTGYEDDCHPRMIFRDGRVRLTVERWDYLKQLNETVRQDMVPERNEL
jgi:predicted transglutaminase-like cysteine proteinase